MHRALSIPEILQLVLSSGVCRITARNAALTCRLWMEPALDELWKDLDSVLPLFWVLVPLKIEQVEYALSKTVWVSTFIVSGGVQTMLNFRWWVVDRPRPRTTPEKLESTGNVRATCSNTRL